MPLFDPLAGRYDRWCETPLGNLTDASELALLLRLLPAPVKGLQVLDVGCGTGTWALRVAQRGANVTAIDESPAMMSVAEAKAQQAGLPVTFTVADASRLSFARGSFDLVTALLVLEFTPDPGAVVSEMARVLRPGGHLLVATLNRHSLWTLLRRIEGRRRPTVYNHARFFTRSELGDLLLRAGLSPVDHGAAVYYPPVPAASARPLLGLLEAAGQRGWGIGPAYLAVRAQKTGS